MRNKFLFILLTLYLGLCQITSLYAEELYELAPSREKPAYSADSVVVMDVSTGAILYSSAGDEILYPASITKIMTALLVLEHTHDLDERVEFSDRAVFSIPRNSSHISMDVGETLSVYEALYGLMLSSANEVSLALAEHVAGSIEAFVELMNRRAQALGATDTHFVNPSGLPGAGHVTTAYDMAIIMREAVRHPLFVDIISARRFDIPPTERQASSRELLNTNRLIHPGQHFNESVVGGKTGWTTAAGHTLVTYARQDGRSLIVSVLGGNSPGTFVDTTALLAYGFAFPFESVQIFNADAYTPSVPIYQTVGNTRMEIGRVTLRADENLYFDLPQGFDPAQLRYNLSVPEGLAAPVEERAVLGRVTVYVQDYRIGDIALLSTETVAVYVPTMDVAHSEGGSIAYTAIPYELPYSYGSAYEYLAAPLWENEYVRMMAIPIAVSIVTLVVSLTAFIIKSKRRRARRMLHNRYARYPEYYRYR